ncbi:protein-glutamine gamma-glutamyltransferase E-like [Xenopus laevis]|uniref:Protein-glutamine gamma-glutamyltransferase E-like n=1 Tax=Xenopus laevis TaxID=8355 RepID=A0A8J1LZ67_XENLA|nr:protein-glutamine gamma-glutamyltransferase E-like [Xenopus laevis]XP_041434719.1 protein-glutamine gamma-glutamyltransferase E-like [Xenopus laevis]
MSSSFPLSNATYISGAFKVTGERVVGKDVAVTLTITNLTCNCKAINVNITAFSILYTNKEMHQLLNETRKLCLKGKEEKEVPLTIKYAQYEDLLTADNMIEVHAVCSSEETNEKLVVETNIVLENPKFEIKLMDKAILNKPVTIQIIFTNPLNKDLTDIMIIVEGSGLINDTITKQGGSVKAKGTITIPVTFTPYKEGERYLLADFTCNKFKNIKGHLEINVQPE